MIALQMVVKMLGREARVARPIKPLDFSLPIDGDPFARGFAKASVQKPRFAIVLISLAPAPERALANDQ